MEGCGRPKPDKQVTNILGLYETCKNRNALPEQGGVLDQSVELMYWFDTIDGIVAKFKEEKREREETLWQMSRRT